MPSQQKRTLGDRTRYSAARGRPHRNDSASFTTTSSISAVPLIIKILLPTARPWVTAREERYLRPDADLDNQTPLRPRRAAAYCARGLLWCAAAAAALPPARPPPANARPRPPALARPRCAAAHIRVRAIVLKSEIKRPIVAGSEINWPIVLSHAPHCSRSIVLHH